MKPVKVRCEFGTFDFIYLGLRNNPPFQITLNECTFVCISLLSNYYIKTLLLLPTYILTQTFKPPNVIIMRKIETTTLFLLCKDVTVPKCFEWVK